MDYRKSGSALILAIGMLATASCSTGTSTASERPPVDRHATSATVGACTGQDVTVSVAKQNPSNVNQPSDYLSVRNTSLASCDIDGYPTVIAQTTGTSTVQVVHQGSYEIRDPGPSATVVGPGKSAYFGVGWVQTNPLCTSVTELRVGLPGDPPDKTVPVSISACASAPATGSIDVTAIRLPSAFSGGAPPP